MRTSSHKITRESSPCRYNIRKKYSCVYSGVEGKDVLVVFPLCKVSVNSYYSVSDFTQKKYPTMVSIENRY